VVGGGGAVRTIVRVDKGVLEVNYMWLPSWIGMNSVLLKELAEHMQKKSVGREFNDDLLDELDTEAIRFLMERFPSIKGLGGYLMGLRGVEFDGNIEEAKG
jgi:hypothetical protein